MLNRETPRIINLPRVEDNRGNLSFIEEFNHIPFKIVRAFWIYDVPGGESRGGHANKTQEEFIIALSGSFDVVVTDVNGEELKFNLNRSYFGLYLPPNTWRRMENFSTNAVSIHLCSTDFDEDDYIRDLGFFMKNSNG